ncbi:MAG: hypothetical protein AAGH68_08915 [Pseudomonadota bacterium]
MKCIYNKDTGQIRGFVQDGDERNLPGPTIPIDPETHAAAAASPHLFRVDLDTLKLEPFEPLPYPDLATAQRAMIGWIDAFMAQFTQGYSAAEVQAFPAKAEAARRYLAAGDAPEPLDAKLIEPEAEKKGIAPADLCHAILANAERLNEIISLTSGLRSELDQRLGLADPSDYAAILTDAQTQAIDEAAALGIAITPPT